MKFEEITLGEPLLLHNGKAPILSDNGSFVVYGSNGTIGRSDKSNHPSSIILGRVGAYCGSVMYSSNPFWASDNTIIVRPIEGHDLKYWYYRLKSLPLRSYAGGAAQPLITHTIIRPIKTKIHTNFEDQVRLASILSAYDDLIENNERRIGLLEESARMLYREWFVHLRFPSYEHSKIVNAVPDGWEAKRLGDVAVTNPESHKSGKLPEVVNYIDIASVSTGIIDTKTEMLASDAPNRARRIARHGDVIWSNVRPNLRAYALVMQPAENDVFSTGFTILRSTDLNPWFLYCFVTSNGFVDHLVNRATGTSYPAVRPEDFEKAEILVPPKALLDAFEDICKPQFEQIAMLQTLSQQAAKARDILLPRLMDGRIEI